VIVDDIDVDVDVVGYCDVDAVYLLIILLTIHVFMIISFLFCIIDGEIESEAKERIEMISNYRQVDR